MVKDLVWGIVVITRGTKEACQSIERSDRCEVADIDIIIMHKTRKWTDDVFHVENRT